MQRRAILYTLCFVLALVLAGIPMTSSAGFRLGASSDRMLGIFPRRSPPTPEGRLRTADELRSRGKTRKATGIYDGIVERWPRSDAASKAQYHYANLLRERGQELEAFAEYRKLIRSYPDTFDLNEVLDQQLGIAERLMTRKKHRWVFGGFHAPERAIPYFEEILRHGADWEKADRVRYLIGKAREQTKEYELAIDAYKEVESHYPESLLMEDVLYSKARCLFLVSREDPKDDTLAAAAAKALDAFLERYPESSYMRRASGYRRTLGGQQQVRAYEKSSRIYDDAHGFTVRALARPAKDTPAKQLAYAQHLQRIGKDGKAANHYRALVLRWPDSTEAPNAQYAYAKLLDKSREYTQAFDDYLFLLSRYPEAVPGKDVLDRMFVIAERVMKARKHRWFFGGFRSPERAIPYFQVLREKGKGWDGAARAHYLLGKAYENNRQHELAAAAFEAAEGSRPAASLDREIRYTKARCLYILARKNPGDVQAAEKAWAALNLYLSNYPDSNYARKAASYRKTLDRQRARTAEKQENAAYSETHRPKKWLVFSRPRRRTPEAQLEYANRLRDTGHTTRAARHYRALLLRWPGSIEAATAQYEYAKLLEKRRKYYKAYDEYKYLMERYAGRFPHDDVLDRQFEIVIRMMNTRKGRLFLGGFEAPERAIPYLQEILQYGPRWERAPEAQHLIGKAYEQTRQYELAIEAYTTTEYRYPDSSFAEKASFSRARCLYILAQESPNDDMAAETSWAALTLFINDYPASEYAPAATEYRKTLYRRRAKTAYDKAVYYDRIARRPKAALIAYKQFVQQFSHSGWTTLAEIRIQELTRTLGAQG